MMLVTIHSDIAICSSWRQSEFGCDDVLRDGTNGIKRGLSYLHSSSPSLYSFHLLVLRSKSKGYYDFPNSHAEFVSFQAFLGALTASFVHCITTSASHSQIQKLSENAFIYPILRFRDSRGLLACVFCTDWVSPINQIHGIQTDNVPPTVE
jgi:hypothetical protein